MISIKEAAAIIRSGGLVAFPTETVYGLGANALDEAGVKKIYEIKGRPGTSPIIVHVASIEMAKQIAEWPPLAEELAKKYWPGPLTIVSPLLDAGKVYLTSGLPAVGIRMPKHPMALELIREAGVPIAAPSANRFAEISPTTAEHVKAAFGGSLPLLDGGPCEVGIESTVVSVVGGKLTLLRPGMISFDDIEQGVAESAAHPAPGMHHRHYSPKTPLMLVEESPGPQGAYIWRVRNGLAARAVRMPADPVNYAAQLYSVLHKLDAEGWPWIAVENPPSTPEWAAIRDRLQRAASK